MAAGSSLYKKTNLNVGKNRESKSQNLIVLRHMMTKRILKKNRTATSQTTTKKTKVILAAKVMNCPRRGSVGVSLRHRLKKRIVEWPPKDKQLHQLITRKDTDETRDVVILVRDSQHIGEGEILVIMS